MDRFAVRGVADTDDGRPCVIQAWSTSPREVPMSDFTKLDGQLESLTQDEARQVSGGVLPLAVYGLIIMGSLVVDWVIADYLADGHIGE